MEEKVVPKLSIESWNLVKIRFPFTLMQKKILTKVIEVCQRYLKGEWLGKDCRIELKKYNEEKYPVIDFPVRDVAGKSHNYQQVTDGLDSLMQAVMDVPSDGGVEWDYSRATLFWSARASDRRGIVEVEMTPRFWEYLYTLISFKLINPQLVYSFKSVYTVRLYEMLVGNKLDITYSLSHLKDMFCLNEKYPRNSDFIKNVIEVGKRELEKTEACPFFFRYQLTRVGRTIEKIKFEVVEKENSQSIQPASASLPAVKTNPSDEIVASVTSLFRTDMGNGMAEKLAEVEKTIGPQVLGQRLLKIYNSAQALEKAGKLRKPMAGYLSGSLDKIIAEEKEKKQSEQKLQQIAHHHEEKAKTEQSEKKNAEAQRMAKQLGMSYEEYMRACENE